MPVRIGLIVPSSNVTMETELPRLFGALVDSHADFTFHSSRVRMNSVTQDELTKMVQASSVAAEELGDMKPDAIAYACLVALMVQGSNYHERAEKDLTEAVRSSGSDAPVISSAGALLEGIAALGARRVAVVAPYMKPLTERVVSYLECAGPVVVDSVSLEVSDNLAVGCISPELRLAAARNVNVKGADALVLSACVQMPSLDLVDQVEQELGLPVLTAATSTAFALMKRLDLPTRVPRAGSLLDGTH
jgi:maleate isomerase